MAKIKKTFNDLSKRERQIMDVIYSRGGSSVAEVRTNLPNPPSYSSVRTLMRILEEKGYLKHENNGSKYIFFPVIPLEKAKEKALSHVAKTYFDDSPAKIITSILNNSQKELSASDLESISSIISKVRSENV